MSITLSIRRFPSATIVVLTLCASGLAGCGSSQWVRIAEPVDNSGVA